MAEIKVLNSLTLADLGVTETTLGGRLRHLTRILSRVRTYNLALDGPRDSTPAAPEAPPPTENTDPSQTG